MEADVDLFNWFEKFAQGEKTWHNLEHLDQCPYPYFKMIPHHERTFISDFQDTFPYVAWLFQNHCPSVFALVMQDDDRRGVLEPRIYGLRGTGPISGYITGILFNDDLLMLEFKLRFPEYIKA